jgi:hypothetical protein
MSRADCTHDATRIEVDILDDRMAVLKFLTEDEAAHSFRVQRSILELLREDIDLVLPLELYRTRQAP